MPSYNLHVLVKDHNIKYNNDTFTTNQQIYNVQLKRNMLYSYEVLPT